MLRRPSSPSTRRPPPRNTRFISATADCSSRTKQRTVTAVTRSKRSSANGRHSARPCTSMSGRPLARARARAASSIARSASMPTTATPSRTNNEARTPSPQPTSRTREAADAPASSWTSTRSRPSVTAPRADERHAAYPAGSSDTGRARAATGIVKTPGPCRRPAWLPQAHPCCCVVHRR